MNRNSQLAIRLSRSLNQRGLIVTPRRLERWYASGLGASQDLPFETQISHYMEVASLSQSGRDVDVTARRLASRGFECPRLRSAIIQAFGIGMADAPLPVLDLSTGPSGDAQFALVEEIAHSITSDTVGLPSLMIKIFRALKRNASRFADGFSEPGDDQFHSFMVNGLCHLFGGDFYSTTALSAVFNLDATEFDGLDLDFLNNELRIRPADLDASYRGASVAQIVAVAQRLRELAPIAIRHLDIADASEEEIEELSAIIAPAIIYIANLLKAKFEDAAEHFAFSDAVEQVPELA